MASPLVDASAFGLKMTKISRALSPIQSTLGWRDTDSTFAAPSVALATFFAISSICFVSFAGAADDFAVGAPTPGIIAGVMRLCAKDDVW
jgi:hypothetical protein